MIFKVEFDEQVWSKIIDMLADRPFKESGAIINTLAQQFAEQRNQSDMPRAPIKGNGAEKHDSA